MDVSSLKEAKRRLAEKMVGGETVLVPLQGNVADLDEMFVLNDAGTVIWRALDSCNSEKELVASLLDEFDVDPATAEQDVKHFLSQLDQFLNQP